MHLFKIHSNNLPNWEERLEIMRGMPADLLANWCCRVHQRPLEDFKIAIKKMLSGDVVHDYDGLMTLVEQTCVDMGDGAGTMWWLRDNIEVDKHAYSMLREHTCLLPLMIAISSPLGVNGLFGARIEHIAGRIRKMEIWAGLDANRHMFRMIVGKESS